MFVNPAEGPSTAPSSCWGKESTTNNQERTIQLMTCPFPKSKWMEGKSTKRKIKMMEREAMNETEFQSTKTSRQATISFEWNNLTFDFFEINSLDFAISWLYCIYLFWKRFPKQTIFNFIFSWPKSCQPNIFFLRPIFSDVFPGTAQDTAIPRRTKINTLG